MELDVGDKCSGKIWHRTPIIAKEEGLLIKVNHSVPSLSSGSTRFLKACFDSTCDRFIAGDHVGYIFLFDLSINRFTLVQKTGQPCTAIAFSHYQRNEFLVGLGDCSLKCFNSDKGNLVAEMKGHKSAIHSISVDMCGHYALTTSSETTYLWDLNTFTKKHKLNIKEDVGLLQTLFLPNSNIVLTCFCDDTIFAWDLDTMICKYQLPVPSGKTPQYRTFATSQDSRYLIAGGKSRFLHLWNLDTQKLIQVIEMSTKVKAIKQLEFVSYSYQNCVDQMLGVLSQDGILQFINIDTCKLVFDVRTVDSKILFMAVGPGGHHVVTVMEDGKLHIYSVHALRPDLNVPAPQLTRIVIRNKLSDRTSPESSISKVQFLQKSSKLEAKGFNAKNGENTKENLELDGLNKAKLLTILKHYGEYPAKYRMFIWRKLLQLPDNFSAYAALVDKGVHPAYSKLREVYPIKSHQLLRVLQRILSALAHWSPIFGETQYLPSFVFPFVRMYQNNHLVCFELIATIIGLFLIQCNPDMDQCCTIPATYCLLMLLLHNFSSDIKYKVNATDSVNWSQHWFEYFPNPPIYILGLIENTLAHHDLHLLQHFVKYGVTSQVYAWQLLETVFSEVLTQDEWLILWDSILSNHPAFLIVIVVAYNMCARGPLMKCTEIEDFQFFFHHRNALSVKQVVNMAYSLLEALPNDIHPQNKLDRFIPLAKGNYPVFNKYPKFIVDYQVREMERIRQEELEYLRQKNLAIDMQKEIIQKHEQEEQWYRQHKLLLEAEDRRKTMIHDEESKLTEQRKRILAMNREVKMRELTLLEARRQKILQFHKDKTEMELKCLDDELQIMALQRDTETESAIQEAEIKNVELQLQKTLLDQNVGIIEGNDTVPPKGPVEAEIGDGFFRTTDKNQLKNDFETSRLQEKCASDSSSNISQVSFRQKIGAFDDKKSSLLHEVRVMRQRLAKNSRNKRPPLPVA